jgi:hypothetical protein
MLDRQGNVLRVRIFQIVVLHFIRGSSFIIKSNVENIRMIEQIGSDNFSLCAYVFEFTKQ